MTQSRLVTTIVVVWLIAATAVGATGVLADLVPPWPQLILTSLTLVTLLSMWRFGAVHRWAATVDLRVFVAFHLTRFVGIYFLVLYGRGQLPYEFAVVGGWGDIIVATFATVLLMAGSPDGRLRTAYFMWNVLGLMDIPFVVSTATRLAWSDPTSLAPLLRLPLSLLITFIVPIIIATESVNGCETHGVIN